MIWIFLMYISFYSGDTDYCENIDDLARDVDVLLLECSYPEHIKVDAILTASSC